MQCLGVGQSEHLIQSLGVGSWRISYRVWGGSDIATYSLSTDGSAESSHTVWGVGQSEHHVQCLGVGQLELHIECLGVGQLEHDIQCLGWVSQSIT
jgi:hypothetical protein